MAGPETVRPWRQRFDWALYATVLSVLVAAGGLAFTGVSTYYATQVAIDQLAQSREDAGVKERRQASMVSAWSERQTNGGISGVLANRSLDPVTAVYVKGTATSPGETDGQSFIVLIETLPPCSMISLPANVVGRKADEFAADARIRVETIWFRDAQSLKWRRPSDAPLTPSAGPQDLPEFSGNNSNGNDFSIRLAEAVAAAKPMAKCGE
ncbi:hypothetical protein J7E88_26930 [Streptomyces sp. ISL-10]|uniref:hypothetical protein n=1 Tax=Streptomyces sp. ISL-10 TaxID=2819172 RepID=UPI001BE94309|nr:hypothetical protein [Streptomyces sp. ISL-10]MBT2368857.1 hypothetical protein [Streptomyces sp. ISL-10]